MIKLLVVSGSPVEDSSTDILLHRAADALVREVEGAIEVATTFISLNERQIIPCQSCGEAPTPKWCFYDDDLTDVLSLLAECDCLLIGSPIYFDSVSAQLKLLIDRCNCFRPADFANADPNHDFIKLIKRQRPGAMVLVGGEDGWFEGARRAVAGFFKWVEVTNEGLLIYQSKGFGRKGTVRNDESALAQADELGRKLAQLLVKRHGRF
ncbi:MAG: flavodoxin family protein [Candidatus Zixiibacteriota bacterium]